VNVTRSVSASSAMPGSFGQSSADVDRHRGARQMTDARSSLSNVKMVQELRYPRILPESAAHRRDFEA
jgi:hypothetical protein